jgi:hypothetical protein
MPRQ